MSTSASSVRSSIHCSTDYNNDSCCIVADVLVAADITVDVLGPIVADIKVKLDVATTSVKGFKSDQWDEDSANDIAVSLNAIIVVRI